MNQEFVLKELMNRVQVLEQQVKDLQEGHYTVNRAEADGTIAEVLDAIKRNRIVPSPGAKSPLEILRESRDA
jgi:hypothetical protein